MKWHINLIAVIVFISLVTALDVGYNDLNSTKVEISTVVLTESALIRGSDLTGIDGAKLRTYTTDLDIIAISVDNAYLISTIDYDIAGTTITFNNEMYNTMYIILTYAV